MRPPVTNRRRLTRQQRLLRTATGIVLVVAIAALVANLVGGDGKEPLEPQPPTQVDFVGKFAGETEADERPKRKDINTEGAQIVDLLNRWYFEGFVDPVMLAASAAPAKDPFAPVAALFDDKAQDRFKADVNAMTIGEARTELSRVEPTEASARITVYFERGDNARFATADVLFEATGTMRDPLAFPLAIRQKATLTLKKTAKGWLVAFWEATATQDSIEPPPSPSPS